MTCQRCRADPRSSATSASIPRARRCGRYCATRNRQLTASSSGPKNSSRGRPALVNPGMSVYVPSSVVPIQKSIRRLRFLLLEHVVLPLAFLPLRMLIRSWRLTAPRQSLLAELAAWPRVIITIFHGTLLEGLAFTAMWKPYGRRWVVLTTPSLDGQLAVAMLAPFGVRCTPLVSGH